MAGYIVLEAADIAELQKLVRAHQAEGWDCQGGPFTYTWAPGHGPVAAQPAGREDWLYVTFCQAVVRRP